MYPCVLCVIIEKKHKNFPSFIAFQWVSLSSILRLQLNQTYMLHTSTTLFILIVLNSIHNTSTK